MLASWVLVAGLPQSVLKTAGNGRAPGLPPATREVGRSRRLVRHRFERYRRLVWQIGFEGMSDVRAAFRLVTSVFVFGRRPRT
jgi:hypothetical protein